MARALALAGAIADQSTPSDSHRHLTCVVNWSYTAPQSIAACLITDAWQGVECFLTPGKEILVAADGDEVAQHLRTLRSERAQRIGEAARRRVLPNIPTTYGRTELYSDLADLKRRFSFVIAAADLVIVGSYVPEGVAVGEWVVTIARGATAFYDIDNRLRPLRIDRMHSGSQSLRRL